MRLLLLLLGKLSARTEVFLVRIGILSVIAIGTVFLVYYYGFIVLVPPAFIIILVALSMYEDWKFEREMESRSFIKRIRQR